jgi:hypothetical protein
MGFLDGIKELLDWCFCGVCAMVGGLRFFENLPRTSTLIRSNKMILATESLSEEIPSGVELNEPHIQSTSSFDHLSQWSSNAAFINDNEKYSSV